MSSVYMPPHYDGQQSLLHAIASDDRQSLAPMIIAAALYEEDFDFVQHACVQLSKHEDEIVRGNAVLGFGHLARLFGHLSDEAIGIVRDSLRDGSRYVRGQAHAAAGDLNHFLGVNVGPPETE